MAHSTKKKNKSKRDAAKRARREANQTKYQALAADGKNKRSKRSIQNAKKHSSNDKHQHRTSNCGNLACLLCFPLDAWGDKIKKGSAHQPPKPNRHLTRYWRIGNETSIAC